MLLKVSNLHKSIGVKDLFADLNFVLNEREKVALIGRNGFGKSTLFRILSGEDHDWHGEVEKKKNSRIIVTQQEHYFDDTVTPLSYVLESVPDFLHFEKILVDYESGLNTNIDEYTESVHVFSDRGYYYIKELILESLVQFQISRERASEPLIRLSGGEKRFVELVRVMYSGADLALIDEPTNHMDYVGKDQFIDWMRGADEAVLVISHDRDVLNHVDRILELKDGKLIQYGGNYSFYLKENAIKATHAVISYEAGLNRLAKAEKRMEWGNRMKAKSKDWKIRYDRFVRDYNNVKKDIKKPSLWIDQESKSMLDEEVLESYQQYKEKNISVKMQKGTNSRTSLLAVKNLSLGYQEPLFEGITFKLTNEDKIFIKGRNGAGKSTLVRTIISLYNGIEPAAHLFDGEIEPGVELRIGEYEQETDERFLNVGLGEAIRMVYSEIGIDIQTTEIKKLLAQYLFDPVTDEKQYVGTLSGGQKARFQIIKMLANNPNLLILDEPTNHLDLPSIEELENALLQFHGAILYISHDSYFVKKLGGDVISIKKGEE